MEVRLTTNAKEPKTTKKVPVAKKEVTEKVAKQAKTAKAETVAAEVKKETGKFESLSLLNNHIKKDGKFFDVSSRIKELKKMLDGVLNEQRELLNKAHEKERAKKETAKPQRVEKVKPIDPALLVTMEEVQSEPQKTVEKTSATTEEVSVSTAQKEEVKKEEKVPSFIKGRYVPPPQPIFVPSMHQRGPKKPFDKNAPRPFDKTGTPRPFDKNAPRPAFGDKPPFKKPGVGGFSPPPPPPSTNSRGKFDNKKKDSRHDDKKSITKRTLIRKGFIFEDFDEERVGTRKLKNKKEKRQSHVAAKVEKAIITTENLTVKMLSEKIGKTANEIIKHLMILGIPTTINQVVDFPTMELVANELGVELELKVEKTLEKQLQFEIEEVDSPESLKKRPPILTIMGHVDHGKTSLLDTLRKTNVIAGEAGGITQHIGAYSVTHNKEKITFLDTPGHEAFTHMRQRGAKVTDIAILVVAADDGIMPQTIESINHAKAANVPILVAINKIDKPAANVEKVRQMLTEHGLVSEEWGGETMMVPISAKHGQGIDKLLESILLLAEVNEYKANPDRRARGTVVEARVDKGKGCVANIIVQNGTLKVGDIVVSGTSSGRVRAMTDEKGKAIKVAPPSTPVSVLGLVEVPTAGDLIVAVSDDKTAKALVAERVAKQKSEQVVVSSKSTLEEMLSKISIKKDLNIVIKGDVQGSVEALKINLGKIENDEVKVNVVSATVGNITQTDIMMAEISSATIVGFNVKVDGETTREAEKAGIDVRLYSIIYEVMNDIEKLARSMMAPKYKEVIMGRAQVRNVFKITGTGIVAGSYVTGGKITRGGKARVFRNGEIIHEGSIKGLKRFKEDVKDVSEGYECGISVDFTEFKELDEIECYVQELIPN
ncbi:MAG: translation initiation factor IF-2 [Firmicutes bacterium]|nr:translation initiation factor IF-2 [Bacillota bacterium]